MYEATMPPEAASLPDPGDDLIARVVGSPDRTWFFGTGRDSVRALERTLAAAGRALDSFDSVLDFGCGCGRMLLWLEELAGNTSLYGTDIDSEAIAWAREHLAYCKFTVNSADPPLPFDDGTFDLVFNHSVFTHIDAARQDQWLQELNRVTRPGGLVVLTTHGERALDVGGFDIQTRLQDDGIVFIGDQYSGDSPFPPWYQVTYHAPWYVFEHWGRWFEVEAYLPGAALEVQDHVLLSRRSVGKELRPLAARPRQGSTANDESRYAAEQRVEALETQINDMRSTAAWRWATRYWRLRASLRRWS